MHRATIAYLGAAAVATVVYLTAPWSVGAIGVQYVAHELAAVVAIVVATLTRRPAAAVLWWVLAGSLVVWAIGDVFWYTDAARSVSRFPSPADAFYLAGYVGLAAGLGWFGAVHQRQAQIGDLLDALLVAIGVGVPIWLIAVGPAWSEPGAALGGQLVGTAYAVTVLVLVLLVSWCGFGGALATVSGRLLIAGFVALIVANLAYSVELLQDLYAPGAGLDVGWLVFFALIGAAALHPSELTARPRAPKWGRPPARVLFVWSMASIPPLTILGEVVWGEARPELVSVAAVGTLLAVAVMAVRVLLVLEQAGSAVRSEGEQRLVALVERIHDVISLHDRDGRITWVSPAVRHVWGFDDAHHDLLDELIDPDDREAVTTMLAEVAAGEVGELRQVEARIETVAAGRREIEITAVNQLENPAIAGIVVTFHDVTARASERRALEAHANAQSDLADQLERVQEMKDAFLTAVSHDLRTPLTSIRGMSELLTVRGRALADEQRQQLIERVAVNAQRLEDLLLELLDLDRLTRGIHRPDRDVIDVTRIAQDIIDHEEFRSAPIELSGRCDAADVDAAMVASILSNLVGNAVKHNPPGTTILVHIEPADDGRTGVRIVVEDAGRGIPAEQRAQVTEPFVRLDPSRSTPGSGLGLTLVETFARLHGGRFHISDRPGGGTRCVVEMPSATGRTHASVPPRPRGTRTGIGKQADERRTSR